jgi:hypothetical protein
MAGEKTDRGRPETGPHGAGAGEAIQYGRVFHHGTPGPGRMPKLIEYRLSGAITGRACRKT